MEAAAVIWIVAAALLLFGMAGLVLPGLPGAPLMFAGLWLAAWVDNFAYVGAGTLTVIGVLAALTYGVDFAATAFSAKRFGASNRAVAGATIGALAGLFFGLPGILFGPFLGALAGELLTQRNLQGAARAGIGATIGLALGVAAKLALGFLMIGIFGFARFA